MSFDANNAPSAEQVSDVKAEIGESPIWSAADASIYWIDVKGPALFRTSHLEGKTERFALPWDIGGFALEAELGQAPHAALVALRLGLFRYRFDDGRLEMLAEAPFDPRTHRFNETGVDPAGRLWLGVMFDPPEGLLCEKTKGPICSYTAEEGLRLHEVETLTPNGFAWNRGGDRFYVAHTKSGAIRRYRFDAGRGRISQGEDFAQIEAKTGRPDGAAMDAQGFYWCAVHGGGRLQRYSPEGQLDREIALPVDNPTMPVFAGEHLETLYVTSATHGKSNTKPQEGGLLRLNVGVRGQALGRLGFGRGIGA